LQKLPDHTTKLNQKPGMRQCSCTFPVLGV
jgi:hypothetical protein